jgi:N-acetyl-gamma-glutamyl-phosphate reductase
MAPKVFIDGEAGTTGLQIRDRLADRHDITLISLDQARRKEREARREMLNSADIVILCLPDDAAREAVSLIESNTVRVIDASSAHRIADGWTYGFPELSKAQRAAIAGSHRVSNPGCYPTGSIALIRPIVDAGLVPPDWPISVNAISGYTGGGRHMIAEFENEDSPSYTSAPYRIYALTRGHKHVPEMRVHGGLVNSPLFAPSVGRYAQGMIVEIMLPLHTLRAKPRAKDFHDALAQAYAGEHFVEVVSHDEAATIETLDAEGLNGTNRMKLYVFGSDDIGQIRLVAILDNLGKGASGAAVQNLNLMVGFPEATGLDMIFHP